MTRFNRFDHDDALAAIHAARKRGALISKKDEHILNMAASTAICREPCADPDVNRTTFAGALARVNAA